MDDIDRMDAARYIEILGYEIAHKDDDENDDNSPDPGNAVVYRRGTIDMIF